MQGVERDPTVNRTTADLRESCHEWLAGNCTRIHGFPAVLLGRQPLFLRIFSPWQPGRRHYVRNVRLRCLAALSSPSLARGTGRMGDRIGCTEVLFITIAMMGVWPPPSSVFSRTYDQVIRKLRILLVLLRLIQASVQ